MPKDVNKNDRKEKRENKHFFIDFKAELKRVIWPTPKQLVNNTVAVITIVLITAIIVFVLDLVFELMNSYGIDKLRGMVESQNVQTENTTTNQEAQNAVDNILNETNNTENKVTAENSETENNTVNEE